MANSADVNAGDQALASQYNNLRADVLNTSTGHTHDGADSKALATDAVSGNIIADDGVGAGKIAASGVDASTLANTASYENAQTRYYTLGPSDFLPSVTASYDRSVATNPNELKSTSTVAMNYLAGVQLPHGAIVTSFKVYWYRDDASATGNADLYRGDFAGNAPDTMATADSNASSGYHSVDDTTISNGTIDNASYKYFAYVLIDNQSATTDVRFCGAVITYTVTNPLP